MKVSTTRRGGGLESMLRQQQWCGILYDLRKQSGFEGELHDFLLVLPRRVVGFDAKECRANRWNVNQKTILKQAQALYRLKAMGHSGFFVVWFAKVDRIVVFDVQQVIDAEASLGVDEGRRFEEWMQLDCLS